jgi:protein disulfide-isomerase
MIKKWLFLFLSIGSCALASWGEDYLQGRQLSQERDQPLLLAFVGSDWCPWSTKFESEVMLSPDFLKDVEASFVLVKVDFPRRIFIPQEMRKENEKLKGQFHIQEFPTLVLLDSSGELIYKKGYLPASPDEVALELKTAAADYKTLKRADPKALTFEQVKQLYLKAKGLKSEPFQEKLMEMGLKQDKGIFFLLEKYAMLIGKGQRRSDEAKDLRRKVMRRDSKNREGGIRSLAILDFFSRTNASKKTHTPEAVIEPLVAYLETYGKKDPEHVWQLQTMIAQFLLSRDEMVQALKFAKAAEASAPESAKAELAQTVRYITELSQ